MKTSNEKPVPFATSFAETRSQIPLRGEGMAPSPTCQICVMAQTIFSGATTTCEDCRETMPGGSSTVGVSVESIINWPVQQCSCCLSCNHWRSTAGQQSRTKSDKAKTLGRSSLTNWNLWSSALFMKVREDLVVQGWDIFAMFILREMFKANAAKVSWIKWTSRWIQDHPRS